MLFHAFRVVYTVKELDSHAKHGQSLEFFSIVVLDDVNDGGTPYMGISPGRTRPCTHRPEREQPINTLQSAALHGTRSGRMSLKKCVFGCEGKITLFSFPKNPALREQWI